MKLVFDVVVDAVGGPCADSVSGERLLHADASAARPRSLLRRPFDTISSSALRQAAYMTGESSRGLFSPPIPSPSHFARRSGVRRPSHSSPGPRGQETMSCFHLEAAERRSGQKKKKKPPRLVLQETTMSSPLRILRGSDDGLSSSSSSSLDQTGRTKQQPCLQPPPAPPPKTNTHICLFMTRV